MDLFFTSGAQKSLRDPLEIAGKHAKCGTARQGSSRDKRRQTLTAQHKMTAISPCYSATAVIGVGLHNCRSADFSSILRNKKLP